jgi:FkbM family methyltransferase
LDIDPAIICDFLRKAGATPVLVDVGASGAIYGPWRPFASESMFVAFDPDSRDMHPAIAREFKQGHIVPKIVAGAGSKGKSPFYLARFPHCSSMLEPDPIALAPYLFASLFDVERQTECETTNLAAVMDELDLPAIDWLKVDSQGKDLSVIMGLDDARRERLLCIDVEPGFSPFYKGEESFGQIHDALTAQGFWLAHLKSQQFARVRAATIKDAFGVEMTGLDPAAKLFGTSPTAAEARYFPSIELLERRGAGQRDFAVAWSFAVTTGLWGYALELAAAARRGPGAAGPARFMYESSKSTLIALSGQGA